MRDTSVQPYILSKYDFDNKYFKECGLSQLNITRYLRMLIDYKT